MLGGWPAAIWALLHISEQLWRELCLWQICHGTCCRGPLHRCCYYDLEAWGGCSSDLCVSCTSLGYVSKTYKHNHHNLRHWNTYFTISQVDMPTDSARFPQGKTTITLKWMRSALVRATWTLQETNSGSTTTQECLTNDMKIMTIHLKMSIYSQERDLILTPMNGRKKMLQGRFHQTIIFFL